MHQLDGPAGTLSATPEDDLQALNDASAVEQKEVLGYTYGQPHILDTHEHPHIPRHPYLLRKHQRITRH